MAELIYTVQTNTAPPFSLTLKREGTVIDLTDVDTVELYIFKGTTQTNTGHEECTITDADSGQVEYDILTDDLAATGSHTGEIKINYTGGKEEILYDYLRIIPRRTKIE